MMKTLFLIIALMVGGLVSTSGMASPLPPHCDPWIGTHPDPTPPPTPPPGFGDLTTPPRPTPPPVPSEELPDTASPAYGPCSEPTPTPTPTPTPVPSETPEVVETPEPTDDPNQTFDPGMPFLEGSGCSLGGMTSFSGDFVVLFGAALGLGLSLRRRRA